MDWRILDKWGLLDETYLADEESWDVLAEVLTSAGEFGLDSEFYGLDVRKESCVGRARVHVWSVAVRTESRSPLGFSRATGWVLPASALQYPALVRILEDHSITKYVHNQPVDDHAIHNHGVDLRGCVDTLNYSRWVWPHLVTAGGFGLKNLMVVKLHRNPIAEFKEVVGDVRVELVTKQVKATKSICQCGVDNCRKRKGHEKTKQDVVVEKTAEKEVKFAHPLESIVPGHSKWELLVRYAAEDAVAALEIAELAGKQSNPAPFPYTPAPRPAYNQDVTDAVVLMERAGIPIDVEYAERMVVKATEDEEKELTWLFRWFIANGPSGPHRREEVDGIWASPKKLGVLFESMDIPRSPVWKRGKVKSDELKLDSTALQWIARNYEPARQMIGRLLQLRRVRGGKKYMTDMASSGGWVNIICGAAGDADDRNGAVTGRLGVKGVLPAQQLSTREEVDLYQVRRGIIA